MTQVMNMAWKQYKYKDPDPNKAQSTPIHPPTHKKENIVMDGSANVPKSKPIIMGGDVS